MSEEMSPELLEELKRLSVFIYGIILLMWLLFANSIRKTLMLIHKDNQVMIPNQAWFLAIPLFNMYWNFEVAKRLSYSLNNEFFDRKIAVEENPGFSSGMLYSWAFLVSFFPFPNFVQLLCLIVVLVYFILYWIKINQFKDLIVEHNIWLNNQQKNQVEDEN
ncbi:hypothetical protein ACFRAE_05435 [Sphingobacterium sp. HJSM2_6]|uniref:hypothetical protein n=1 Tax=Sphingobacterium sp. HJSM2_6 TaxID=3366264 RepID=UPI003BD2A9A0